MDCPSCARNIPTHARFCAFCGTPIRHCPSCEVYCPPDADFCGHCGAPLRGDEPSAPSLDGGFGGGDGPPDLAAEDEKWLHRDRESVFGFLYDPRFPEHRHYMECGDTTIGAGEKNDFVLDQPAVSWNHALVICRNDKVLLQDSASTNGTFVNDVRVTRPRELRHGDQLRFGNVEFRVWIKPQLRRTGVS